MQKSWFERVEGYCNDLEGLASEIEKTIGVIRVDTTECRAREVEEANANLMETLAALETKVSEREVLLASGDAPKIGTTLTEKIELSTETGRFELGSRCRQLSQQLARVNQKAVSLFVCQFHLTQLSHDIVRLIARQDDPETYQSPSLGKKEGGLGGGLFNEAA